MNDLQIEKVKLSDLSHYEKNARLHSKHQIEQLARSIEEFGFTVPLLIDEKNTIIAGHGRANAASELGWKEVPCIRLENLSEAQKKAYIIADNKLAMNAEWDTHLLKMEANELKELGFDVDLLGFSDTELKAFFGDVVDDPSKEWEGMPDFTQNDETAFRTIVIHFPNQEAVDEFASVIEKPISESTKYIWYPEIVEVPQSVMVGEDEA